MKNFVLGPHAAQQVRELINSNAATLAKRRTRAALGLPVDPPHPFRVQWAASADDGDGAWLIYLPATNLVVIANHTADPADDLDEVGGDYPEGWYVLPDSVLDRDDGGVLYCNLDTTAFTATLSMTPGTFAVPVCEATVDSATGARQVQQFVTSAIVTAPPAAANDYDCDEVSLSQRAAGSVPSGFFSIKGFGRFSPRAGVTLGSYQAATDAELEVGGDDSGFAVLCRTGNQDVVGANALAYRKLKIGTAGSSPFAFAKTVTTSGGESVVTCKLVNCVFYWGGVLQQLADYTIDSGTLAAGTVYLSGTLAAAGSAWSWALGTAQASAPAGGRVLNYKLYDFAQGKISLDYRTTFLALSDPAPAAAPTTTPGCFDISDITGTTLTLARCHYMVGGRVRTLVSNPATVTNLANDNVVALKISARSSNPDTLAVYSSLLALQQAQEDFDYYLIPLYQIAVADGASSIACDFRRLPLAAMWEG